MSTFEPAEVDALAAGGNAAAALTWLGALSREQISAMAPLKTAKQVVRARKRPCGRGARAPTCSFGRSGALAADARDLQRKGLRVFLTRCSVV